MSGADSGRGSAAAPDELSDSARAFLDYLAEMAREFHMMAGRERLPFLAYLLGMVQLEAERTLHRRRELKREKPGLARSEAGLEG